MSRKHFELIAAGIRTIADYTARQQAAQTLASVCKQVNPRFSLERFMAACNVSA